MICGQGGLYVIRKGGSTFGGMGIQGQSDISSVRNIFKGSFTKEWKVSGKAIFEVGFDFPASETMKEFNVTASEYQGVIGSDWG